MTMAKCVVEDYLYMIEPAMALKRAFNHCQKELMEINSKKVQMKEFSGLTNFWPIRVNI